MSSHGSIAARNGGIISNMTRRIAARTVVRLFGMSALMVASMSLVSPPAGGQTAAMPSRSAVAEVHYDGFVIRARRAVKSGDAIPVLVVSSASGGAMSVLSVEASEGATEPSKAEPWFSAFPEATTMQDRAAVVEAWKVEKGYVASPLGTAFAGTISVKANPSAANKAFACSFDQEEGEAFAAYTSEGGAKSTNTMPVADGANEVQYPFMTMLKGSDGNFRTVLPALLRAKADMRNNAGVLTISASTAAMQKDTPAANSELIPGTAGSSLWCKKEDTYSKYVRFYSGGTVIAVSSTGTGTPNESWFNEAWKRSGKYSVRDSSVKFSIGTTDYDGVIQGASLQLKVRSPINNRPARQERYEACH